jgi:recombinational DNA repair protein (RecF pathway)
MDSRHCCVCGREIASFDVYILRAQGKICSQCVVERGIPVGGPSSGRQPLPLRGWRRPELRTPPALSLPMV